MFSSQKTSRTAGSIGFIPGVTLPSKISAERTPVANPSEKPIRERQLSAYHRALTLVEGLRVLELGCGEGIGASLLVDKAASIVALDYSQEALDVAKKRYGNPGIQFRRSQVPPIDYPEGSFEAVVCFQMVEHLQNPKELLAEIRRVLTENGVALISTVNKEESISSNPYHLHEFTATEFKNLLEQHFPKVEMYGVFGDEVFTQYWRNNRRWVNNFMRLDVLHLAERLPQHLKVRLFDLSSRLMRNSLRRRNSHLCEGITHKNFLYRLNEYAGCLDFFAVCHNLKT